jgi:putative phosphoribosyl transferase
MPVFTRWVSYAVWTEWVYNKWQVRPMTINEAQPIFESRQDAGRKLAQELEKYEEKVVVLGIPNGGVPIGMEIAGVMPKADFSLIISRKIPVPLNPEAGFGAIADDGTLIIDDDIVLKMALPLTQINYEVDRVRENVKQRTLLYSRERPLVLVDGKVVIITDDGLASGYTMVAAVESIRRRRPKEIVVAVPVAWEKALERVEKVADKVVTCATSTTSKFYIADYYRRWGEVRDDDVIAYLQQWRNRHMRL